MGQSRWASLEVVDRRAVTDIGGGTWAMETQGTALALSPSDPAGGLKAPIGACVQLGPDQDQPPGCRS